MEGTTLNTEAPAASKYSFVIGEEDDKTSTIILNVETEIKSLVNNLAKRQEISGIDLDPEVFSHLPNSLTGVVVHYLRKGIKEDFDIEFSQEPTSVKKRGSSSTAGKGRTKLSRNKKNNIIERTQLSFYEKDIASGLLSIEAAMEKIKEAYGEKLDWETKGWTLPPAKTAYPVFSGEEED